MGTDILEIIRRAYQLEVDGYTFYTMTAGQARKPTVRKLFERLAQDERQHQQYLREVSNHYDQKGNAAFDVPRDTPDLDAFTTSVFTEELRKEAEGAEFEAAVLSVGMTLESNSIAHYNGASRAATNDQARAFYQFLAVWERQHLVALQNAYRAVRTDFWNKSGL
ncbi:MAG: ferritin family protein [Bacteroidales bacterium]